jgi:hypothetical protein
MSMIERRLARLKQEAQIPDAGDIAEEEKRWGQTVENFVAVLPDDLEDLVTEAIQDTSCPLWQWFENLHNGRSRLPACLTEEVVRELVRIRLEEADRCESFAAVCLQCGLEYPVHKAPPVTEWKLAPGCSPDERPLRYNLPHFFSHDGCPACGESSKAGHMQWAHRIPDGFWFTEL